MRKENTWTLEQGQVTWEEYRDAVYHCREKIRGAKAQLEYNLASTVKVFVKYGSNNRRIRDNIAL